MPDNEIPGMDGLCWSDLPLTDEEIEDLQMSGVFDDDRSWSIRTDAYRYDDEGDERR